MDGTENRPEFRLNVAEDIVPMGEFKTQLSKRLKQVNDVHRPLVVTQNGKPAAVVLSPAEFDRLTYRARFIAAVEDGLAQADAGRTVSHAKVLRGLEKRFGTASKKKK